MENSKAELESRYESRLNQLQQLNESLDASGMFESQEAELDKLRSTQVAQQLRTSTEQICPELQVITCTSVCKIVAKCPRRTLAQLQDRL